MLQKTPLRKLKDKPQGKICATYIYDKGLIPRIYEEFFKLNNKTYNEKEKWLLPGWGKECTK